ncbi:hypothetical protein [Micromonospora sp. NPDC049240]|uniref:hypothetical protein n=1 Tax=Micromonospora sp. NPDC049240 TaxID=3155151 RepID=UPI0033FC0A70
MSFADLPLSTKPTITCEHLAGGYRVTVRFPAGVFAARRPVVGPVRPTIAVATSAALARAAGVIAEILTPREYPNVDVDLAYNPAPLT